MPDPSKDKNVKMKAPNRARYHQGKYAPRNPAKYIGMLNEIFFRSSWEWKFMQWCDLTESVVGWTSENVIVPYISPVDGAWHRYFVDFGIKVKNKEGKEDFYLVEIKPKKERTMPVQPSRCTQKYKNALETWLVNKAKWDAATAYAEQRGWKFLLIDDEDLHIK